MLKIVQSPDPLLNQVCEPCDLKDRSLKKLAKQMERTMYATDGIGIAAQQVGVLKRLIVVETTPEDENGARNPLVLVNPEIVETWGEPEVNDEGCLSCPGIYVPIERKPWARVRYQDFKGEQWEIESDGLLGRCLQHEIDHLNGITLFESASPRERIKALTAYEEARRLGAKPGEVSVDKRRVR
ncbi:MAG: peptide deformylase [Eggerthellaceae bacterium]|nr:peptide deformylase [Eggerthellaceae bacterium]